MAAHKEPPAGPAISKLGGPWIDPTPNVIALNEAANRRQDDLREASDKFNEAMHMHGKELSQLRADYQGLLDAKESDRLDKIRQVDILNSSTAAAAALNAIQTLANTTASNAENLRGLVVSTAATVATQTAQTFLAVTERIAALEKSSYEGLGRQRVADPQIAEMLQEMKSLRESRAAGTAKGEGINALWVWLVGAIGVVGVFYSIFVRQNPPQPPSAPQVVYMPAAPAPAPAYQPPTPAQVTVPAQTVPVEPGKK